MIIELIVHYVDLKYQNLFNSNEYRKLYMTLHRLPFILFSVQCVIQLDVTASLTRCCMNTRKDTSSVKI